MLCHRMVVRLLSGTSCREFGRSAAVNSLPVEAADYRWRWLYRAGGAAALFAVAIIPIQLFVFIAWG